MRYTDDALYPENMAPLIITAAPYGPTWLPGDATDIAVTWDEQVQAAVDCYNAGARVLHLHVRNPATGHLSRGHRALQLHDGAPQGSRARDDHPGRRLDRLHQPKERRRKAEWLDYDTRHMLAEITPKPETVTVAIGTSMFDITQMWTADDIKGTHLEDPKVIAAYAGMFTDAGPAFYLEHLKRLRAKQDPALLHAGARAPARDRGAADPPRRLHGPAEHEHHHVRRRRVRPQPVRLDALAPAPTAGCDRHVLGRRCGSPRSPSRWRSSWASTCRVGIEDNLWNSKRERMTTLQQIEAVVSSPRSRGARRPTQSRDPATTRSRGALRMG